jgi:hypothetical protein
MSKRNTLENIKLCAEALGYRVISEHDTSVFVTNGSEHFWFNPYTNNALAMNLIKTYPHETLPAMTDSINTAANVPEMVTRALNLNEVVVEAIANKIRTDRANTRKR